MWEFVKNINFKMTFFFPVLFYTILFVMGCANNGEEDEFTPNECINQRDCAPEILSIVVEKTGKNCSGFEISCPVGEVCDENYLYRAYSYDDEDIHLSISFNPEIVGNYSLASFEENFEYIDFQIYFPEKNTGDSIFYFKNLNPVRQLGRTSSEGLKFTFNAYENGNIQGAIEGTITTITEYIKSDSLDCFTDDIMGICYTSEEANIPFNITFNLPLE